jgi:precorrin-8X/cobalt-precorrin-8 methylmutase
MRLPSPKIPQETPTLSSPASGGGSGNIATLPSPARGGAPGRPPARAGVPGAGSEQARSKRDNQRSSQQLAYLRDPAEISRRSIALIREEADLARFPHSLRRLALRLAQAAGDAAILDRLDWSRGAVAAGRRALRGGAPILVDARMVAAGVSRERLPAANEVLCTLRDPAVGELAKTFGTTRSAASIELWRPYLSGAVVAIGNAPTALFRLLELIASEGMKPVLILGFPVGFVGAAEAKRALADFGRGLAFVTLHGRRGGSAVAAAAVNALAGP